MKRIAFRKILVPTAALMLACGVQSVVAQTQLLYMAVLNSRAHQWSRNDNPAIGLFVSSDQGATWEHRGWREYIRTFHAVEGKDGTLWLACGNGVLRSTDAGGSWRVTTGWEVTEVLRIAVDPGRPKNVYAATAYGLIASTDRGATWEFRTNGLRRTFTADVCVDRRKGDHLLIATETGVFVSKDAGKHWRPTTLTQKDIRTIVQDPHAAATYWAGTEDDGVWLSTDGGESWSPRNQGLGQKTVYTIVLDKAEPGFMMLGTHGSGVYISSDHGTSWHQRVNGLTNLDVHSVAVVHGTPTKLFAGTLNDGLFESIDGGVHWTFNSQHDAQVWGLSVGAGRRPEKQ
jgi:photosystem II stability/assembly factor-like uncharacterized protein